MATEMMMHFTHELRIKKDFLQSMKKKKFITPKMKVRIFLLKPIVVDQISTRSIAQFANYYGKI